MRRFKIIYLFQDVVACLEGTFGSKEFGDEIKIKQQNFPQGHPCYSENSVVFLAAFDKNVITKLEIVDESEANLDFTEVFDILYDGVDEGACFIFKPNLTFLQYKR